MIVLTLIVLLAGSLILFGALPPLFRLVGSIAGAQLTSRAKQRRDLHFSRAAEDEKKQELQRVDAGVKVAGSSSSTASLDDDWEKINKVDSTTHETEPKDDYAGVIAFFHPFCNAGGGGERVLFAAISATQKRYPQALCAVYTGDQDASKETILTNVRDRFNITLHAPRVVFIYLTSREYVLASTWPHFTLLGQSLGSLVLAWEAFTLLTPDIYIDTMGYAFTIALAKWLFPKMPTAAYVHYPTISTDMLSSLQDDTGTHGLNSGGGRGARGKAKQLYWNLFAKLYTWAGGHVDVVMTNSSWTQNHVAALWTNSRKQRGKTIPIQVVYPPCAVQELQSKIEVDAVSERTRTHDLLYIAQFRPEKMHHVIIEAFEEFLRAHKDLVAALEPPPRLVLLGSVRDDTDEKRVYKLRLQAQAIRDNVEFVVNAKWPQILSALKTSSVGVNGMWNEHFGIGVVEYQAAGLIAVVNNSGGPKEDIVVDIDGQPTGYLASTPVEFSNVFAKALSLSGDEQLAMRHRARKSALRFSESVFGKAWITQLEGLIKH